jgi:hypothetical protein
MGYSKPSHLHHHHHHHLLQARVSKKVSWAAGDRLCQVILFFSSTPATSLAV